MDPNTYQIITKAHQLVKESKGNLSPEQVAYLSGVLESVLAIWRDTEQMPVPEPKGLKKILG